MAAKDQIDTPPDLTDNAAIASEPTEDGVKCDNHPGRKGRTFTGNGAYEINLCEECTPSWFKDAE